MSVAKGREPHDSAPSDELRLARRDLFPLVGSSALAPLMAPTVAAAAQERTVEQDEKEEQDDGRQAPSRFVYVGTYTKPNTAPGGTAPSTALGIYVFKMNGRNGALTLQQVEEIENPSWVATDASMTHLYATSEVSTWKGAANSGGITAYSIATGTGRLTPINDQPTMGAIPAHVILDKSGQFALV